MKIKHLLCVPLFCAMAQQAVAQPDRVSILLGSAHPNATREYEEVNPGVFVTWEDRALGLDYSVGAFRNSFGRASVAALASAPLATWENSEVAVFGGAALYPDDGRNFPVHVGDVIPLIGIQLRSDAFFTQILFKDAQASIGVISFGVTFELEE